MPTLDHPVPPALGTVEQEIQRTRPDFVVYVPGSLDGSTGDTGNEHFLVFDGPDGSLMAVWTQSTIEGWADQRIRFSRSTDEGVTWETPRVIAGTEPGVAGPMCSWAFPLVSRSGRIYVLYSRHMGINEIATHTTGRLAGIFSDDSGVTWTGEAFVPTPRSQWDNPNPAIPPNCIIWQAPRRLAGGRYLVGQTRSISPAVCAPAPVNHWTAGATVTEFLRFENLDENPAVEDLKISWLAQNENALGVGFPGYPEVPVLQEPSLVLLPDGRLFAVMRSPRGNPYYSISADHGDTWAEPKVLLNHDGGAPLLHPCSPCPIYELDSGSYLFLFHNHDGHFEGWGPYDSNHHRRPIHGARGEFRPGAEQPVWFSEPEFLMDNGGVTIGYGHGRADLAMYASFTIRHGQRTLWYPDRKVFLLGKRIEGDWLTLPVPA